jgi:hypothetical protein
MSDARRDQQRRPWQQQTPQSGPGATDLQDRALRQIRYARILRQTALLLRTIRAAMVEDGLEQAPVALAESLDAIEAAQQTLRRAMSQAYESESEPESG